MIAVVLATVLAVSAIGDTTTALPGTTLRFGMESGRFGAAQGFQPTPRPQPPDRQERSGPLRFFGIDATATLSFLDRRLVQADIVIENASPQQIAYIDDDLVRRGYRRACMVRERERSQCTWTGATRIELNREGTRITAAVRPLARDERPGAAAALASEPAADAAPGGGDVDSTGATAGAAPALPDTMPVLPGLVTGDSMRAHVVYRALPSYPEAARRAGVQGLVRVEALVDTTGAVVDTRIPRSIPELDGEAIAVARQFRFRPWESEGRRVGAWVEVPVRFTIH